MRLIHFAENLTETGLLSCLLFGDIAAFSLSHAQEKLLEIDDCYSRIGNNLTSLYELKERIHIKNISVMRYKKLFTEQGIPETVLPDTLDSFSLLLYVIILSLISVKNETIFISGIKLAPENSTNIFGWLKKNKITITEKGSKITELLSYILGQLCIPFDSQNEYRVISANDVPDLLKPKEINKIFSIKDSPHHTWETDKIIVIETNIDDMTPEILSFSLDEILKKGALDFLVFPVTMKKGRSAVCVQILCTEDKAEELAEFLFEWTSTFGIRMYPVDRWKLKREFVDLETPYGKLKYKKGKIKENLYKLSPEFEDLKKISLTNGQSPLTLLNNIYKLTNK